MVHFLRAEPNSPNRTFTCRRNRIDRICTDALPTLDSAFTLNRMEANHVHCRYSKKRLRGLRRFLLSAPSAREDVTLSIGVEALPGVQAAVGRGRQDTAGLCVTGIRRLQSLSILGRIVEIGCLYFL